MQAFADSIWYVDGGEVSFFGFPYPTRMAVVRLNNGDLWVWSPIAISDDLVAAIDAVGPVRHLVSPNKIHHLFLQDWQTHYPDARVYASPGLAQRRPDISFDAELTDQPEAAWQGQVEQVIFHGSVDFVLRHVFGAREGGAGGDGGHAARSMARAARAALLAWKPDRLLIAHGELATGGATDLIAESLSWLGD